MARYKFQIVSDKTGKLFLNSQANTDQEYYCPACKEQLIPKCTKHRFIKKPTQFIHNEGISCTGLTRKYLIELIESFLKNHIQESKSLDIVWDCTLCDTGSHIIDILSQAKDVAIRYSFEGFDTDIVLIDENENLCAVIMILEGRAHLSNEFHRYFQRGGIPVIEYKLYSTTSINHIAEYLKHPHSIDLCTYNHRCTKCGEYLKKRNLYIIDGSCWKCKKPMKIACTRGDYGTGSPIGFTQKEFELCTRNGVVIRNKFSYTQEESYLANICPHCKSMIGEHFLHTDYFAPATMGELNYIVLPGDYICEGMDCFMDEEEY